MLLGTAWGNLLNPEPERRIEIETEAGPVSGRVDLDLMIDGRPVPMELKLTNYSQKKPLSDMGQYVEQLAGYVIATPESLGQGLLGILHLGMPQTFRVWDLQWASEELGAFEKELGRRALVVTGPTLPSIGDHYTWECRYCDYHEKRGGPCPGGKGKVVGFFDVNQD